MRHSKVGHHDLVSTGSRTPQLPERGSSVFCLVGFPSPPAEIARQRRSDRRLVVDYQRTPHAARGRYGSEWVWIGKDQEARLKPRLMEGQGEAVYELWLHRIILNDSAGLPAWPS